MLSPDSSSRRDFLHLAGLAAGAAGLAAAPGSAAPKEAITEADVKAAQNAWCAALVKIGKVHGEGGDYKAAASQLIDDLYDYAGGRVFFRPTLATSPRAFRKTKEGALAYFVGGNPNYPEDKGFALQPWVKVWVDDDDQYNGVQIHGDIAITMGNVHLTGKSGNEVTVDKTFVFRKCPDGKLRLIVHKSALPNAPA
jgi:hypothetical protein